MYLGYNTNGFAHHRLADAVDILADLGYEGIGLTFDYHTVNVLAAGWERDAERMRASARVGEHARVAAACAAGQLLEAISA